VKGRVFWVVLLCSLETAYYSTLKMEVVCSSETLVSLWTTQHYNSEDDTLPSDRSENIESNKTGYILFYQSSWCCGFYLYWYGVLSIFFWPIWFNHQGNSGKTTETNHAILPTSNTYKSVFDPVTCNTSSVYTLCHIWHKHENSFEG
jgi:hypothetical protein